MDIIDPVLLILGGILALSGLILARKPDAKAMIDKLMPYQAMIGVALLAFGVINVIRLMPHLDNLFQLPFFGGAIVGMIGCSVLLGLLLGMPQIAKWMGNASGAEHKVAEMAAKVAPYQTLIGIIGIVSSVVFLYYRFIKF